ncbi:MAG: class I SAM-dependent methyltransferase, partial [Acidobacteriota bacterium]|nr:class I SAM-dependent methyltransferase [Acidobacteriota bacterium]
MSERENDGRQPTVASFLSGENRRLSDWRWLWEGDHAFPLRSHRGALGYLIVAAKKALRSLVRAPQSDLWERQRAYNLIIQEHLEKSADLQRSVEERLESQDARTADIVGSLGKDLQIVQRELSRDLRLSQEAHARDQEAFQGEVRTVQDELWKFLESHNDRLQVLEGFHNDGWNEVRDHTAALFARLDQKLDRYRQLTRDRWDRLGSLLEVAQSGGSPALARVVNEEKYVEFEGLFRGREEDIGDRLAPYLEILTGRGEVLDLGCGRGEGLEALVAENIPCRGVDSSSEMVERCRSKPLDAHVGDL